MTMMPSAIASSTPKRGPVRVFCGRGNLRNQDGCASERGQFLSKREQEVTNQLLALNFVTERGHRIDDQAGHTDGVDNVHNGLDESVDVVEFKRGLLETKPRIQNVHVEDVDQPGIDHVHVEKRVLADVFKQASPKVLLP